MAGREPQLSRVSRLSEMNERGKVEIGKKEKASVLSEGNPDCVQQAK